MLEVTAEDIARLNDGDLRNLVGLLCEAEVRRRGSSTSAVTWGGDQDAPDGGLDVRVTLPKRKIGKGFIPRRATGFQMKKSDMTAKAILKEMRPAGKIRPVIAELARQSGAYIIVSSNGSVTDSALRRRREAMVRAAKGIKNGSDLYVDFYDRSRIATWVRDHPGLIFWVQNRLGKSLRGWRPYGPWANAAENLKASYLLDQTLRVHTGKREKDNGLSAVDGLNRVRGILRDPRKVVRIVGLSGVGKTRFIQALFDNRIGNTALDPSLAIYTNMSDDPDPQPIGLASQLIATKARAILVVDNCTPDLHRRLSETCRAEDSLLNLMTVEYDIRDDDPEETDVIRLQPSSDALIEKLVRMRFRSVSEVDVRTIANFSGGNARIAIALAGTIGKNETLAGLTDEEVFKRLFEQRHGSDSSLLLIAQACSLVYSFQGEALSGPHAELPVFATLIGKAPSEIYQGIAELLARGLIQQRGEWRAVLPHAIANRLAEMALRNLPTQLIHQNLTASASDRLLKSFSRRLGYLHDNKWAAQIVNGWLSPGGLLADISALSYMSMDIFENIAPVVPESILAAIERADLKNIHGCNRLARIVRSIAYDPQLFERSVRLLLRIQATKEERSGRKEIHRDFAALFFVYFSGTHASVEQRLAIVESLLRSDSPEERNAGIHSLSNMLEAWDFGSGFNFEFGARPRDYGFWPKTTSELTRWFVSALKLAESIGPSGLPAAAQVRAALASKFRGLWAQTSLQAELARVCHVISNHRFWREGWIAIRETLQYDGKSMTWSSRAKLRKLEKGLRPKNLVHTVRAVVLSQGLHGLDDFDDDDDEASTRRPEDIAISLGREAAHDKGALRELGSELMSGEGRLWHFGRGLGLEASDPEETWGFLVNQFHAAPLATKHPLVLCGFLQGLHVRDSNHANSLLDAAVSHAVLGTWFPQLQSAVRIDAEGVRRLRESLDSHKAPAWRYQCLSLGRASDTISGPDLKELLAVLRSMDGGFDATIEILYMRLFSDRDQNKPIHPSLLEAGVDLLKYLNFTNDKPREDHRIGSIIKLCLSNTDGSSHVTGICERFLAAVRARSTNAFDRTNFLQSLFKVQPLAALDGFFARPVAEQKRFCHVIWDVSRHHKNPLSFVSCATMLDWCDKEPRGRYPLMAEVVDVFAKGDDGNRAGRTAGPVTWSEVALALIDKAPDKVAVLKTFARRFRPMMWSGSRAATMETRLPLLNYLENNADPAIAAFGKADAVRLRQEIELERRSERQEDRIRDERFE